jgi:hypothetical protein
MAGRPILNVIRFGSAAQFFKEIKIVEPEDLQVHRIMHRQF